jgi:phosphoglycerate dehydrogenase-like enzyme
MKLNRDMPPYASKRPVLVVEDDPWTRVIQVVLDPETSPERRAAFADFMSPDEPNFEAWCDEVRRRAGPFYPCEVRMISSQAEMRADVRNADALVVESFVVGRDELREAARLKVVCKYGTILRNIDEHECRHRGIKILTLRRRANIACAEHAFAMMLTLARRMHELNGKISVKQLGNAGYPYIPFDRRHTPNGNWARVPATRSLHSSTIGIIGLGEIGREIALRARAFGMRVLYFQRTQLAEVEEETLQVSYAPLTSLLSQSDWIVPQLPGGPSTLHLLSWEQFAVIKSTACIINVSRADVADRAALVDALRSGRLGGFALDALYEEPGNDNDELLTFANVIMVPHMAGSPRSNGLSDLNELISAIAREMASGKMN